MWTGVVKLYRELKENVERMKSSLISNVLGSNSSVLRDLNNQYILLKTPRTRLMFIDHFLFARFPASNIHPHEVYLIIYSIYYMSYTCYKSIR